MAIDYLQRARDGAEEKARYLATMVDSGTDAVGELLGGVVVATTTAIAGSLADALGDVLGGVYNYTPTDEVLAALGELIEMDIDNENRVSNNVLDNLNTVSGFLSWLSEADVNLEELSEELYDVSDGAYDYSREKWRTLALVNEIAQMEAGIHPKGFGRDSPEYEFAELVLDQSWVAADDKAAELLESSVDSASWANDLWLSAGPTRGIKIGNLNADEISLWRDVGFLYHNGVLYGDPFDVNPTTLGVEGDARDFWTAIYRANGIVGAAKAGSAAQGGAASKAKAAATSTAAKTFWAASVIDWLDLTDAAASAEFLVDVDPIGVPSVVDSQPDAEEETPPLGEGVIYPEGWDFSVPPNGLKGMDLNLPDFDFDLRPRLDLTPEEESWPWDDITPPDPPTIPPVEIDLANLYRQLVIAFGVGAAVGFFASAGLALPDNHAEINLEVEGTKDDEDDSEESVEDEEEEVPPPLPTYSFEGVDLEIGTGDSDDQELNGSMPP